MNDLCSNGGRLLAGCSNSHSVVNHALVGTEHYRLYLKVWNSLKREKRMKHEVSEGINYSLTSSQVYP